MTGTCKKKAPQSERKTKSSLSSLKKKLNIPKIYKRIASKLSIHGRNIRSLTNSWSTDELRLLVSQYELIACLKELFDAAEWARRCAQSVTEDMLKLQQQSYLCDLYLKLELKDDQISRQSSTVCIPVHSTLFSKRTRVILPKDQSYRRNLNCPPHSASESDQYIIDVIPRGLAELCSASIVLKYSTSKRTLVLSSDRVLPKNLLEDWISFVYGDMRPCKASHHQLKEEQRPEEKKSSSSLSSALQKERDHSCINAQPIPQKLDVIDHLPHNSSNSEKRSVEQMATVGNSHKFTDEFRNNMKDLLLSANTTGDVKLVFSVSSILSVLSSHLRARQPGLCCHGHSFVLAARSPFFRNILHKHRERHKEESNCIPFMTIELDWKVFPPRYFPVVLYTMYTDEVDLQRIIKTAPLSLQRVDAGTLSTDVKDLMELLYIGRFLEFPSLAQGCENSLYDKLSVSNLLEMLHWSAQPHGSAWLHRQIMRYARENFQQLMTSGILLQLKSTELSEVIQSDFVNAPELDVLRTVLKWGEQELLRRLDQEPNLVRTHVHLNQTPRNFRAISSRRREVLANNTDELHECTASLLSRVRIRHVLPANHEVLTSAIKRGVISCPPEHLLEWHHHSGATNENAFFWLRDKAGLGFSSPRLFTPHVTEVKAVLEERLCQEMSASANVKMIRQASTQVPTGTSAVPDALYMVKQVRRSSRPPSIHNASCDKCRLPRIGVASLATSRLKYIDNRYPVPSPAIARKLVARERLLRQSSWIKRTLQACHSSSLSVPHCCCRSERHSMTETNNVIGGSMLCNLCRAEHYIRLLVIREHDLPDAAVDILRKPHLYYDPDELYAASTAKADVDGNDFPLKIRLHQHITPTTAPKRLQKLFHKKLATPREPETDLIIANPGWENMGGERSSGSDLSISDDSSSDWPFPYSGLDMDALGQPGGAFWDSDSSLTRIPQRHMPDVAASASSTLSGNRPRISSSSSSDSSVSVTCRLVAQSRPLTSHNTTRSPFDRTCTTTVRKSVTSYAHYLSMRKSKTAERGNSAHVVLRTNYPISTPADLLPTPTNQPSTSAMSVEDKSAGNVIPQLVSEGMIAEKSPHNPPDLCARTFHRENTFIGSLVEGNAIITSSSGTTPEESVIALSSQRNDVEKVNRS